MKLNRIFLVSLIILAILTVGAVSASDNVTSDDLSSNLEDSDALESSIDDDLSAIGDDSDDKKVNEEIEETDNILSSGNDDIIGVEENDVNTIIGKEVADDEPVLTSTDKEVTRTWKVTFYKQTGKYVKDKKIYLKITDAKTGRIIDFGTEDTMVLKVYKNNKYIDSVFVDTPGGKGVLKWNDEIFGDGVFTIKPDPATDVYDYELDKPGYVKWNVAKTKVVVKPYKVTIKAKKLTVPKKSKKKFVIKVMGQNKKPYKGVAIRIKVYTGKKAKTYEKTTNSKGIVTYNRVSKLSNGKHKVKISVLHTYSNGDIDMGSLGVYGKSVTSYITIKSSTNIKSSIKISAPKVTANYKKSTLFKVTVKNKKSGKSLKGVKVIMKVYTGKKFKKIVHKTNKKGKTGFNTKSLSKGKHKVVVIVKANSKYKKAVKKSSVTIKGKTNKNKNSNSKNKNKKSSTNKGKLRTKLTIEECYRTGNIGEIFIKVSLKDSKGRPLANKEISIDTVAYLGPMSQPTYNTATTDSKGIAQGYVTSMLGGIATYDVTVKFSGDKSHKSSSASTYLD